MSVKQLYMLFAASLLVCFVAAYMDQQELIARRNHEYRMKLLEGVAPCASR